MITKKQFCKKVISDFEEENGRLPNSGDIFSSSTLAVAMEYLGLLTDNRDLNYAAERGGHFLSFYDKETGEYSILSTRELLDLLPS
jgi:hypothetical protein